MKSRFIAAMDLLQEEAATEELTLARVFELLGREGHGILLLFLCLPFLQPIPIPGLSTPFGLLIVLVAFFLYLRKPPWLPKKFEKIHVSSKVLIKCSEVAEKIWSYAARVIRQRLLIFCDFPLFRLLNLAVVCLNAFLLALPLPIPFSNTVPVIGIVLCGIGHLEKDGLLMLLSYLWLGVVISFFTALGVGVTHFV